RGEAYVWNCVTLPSHRNQGIFWALLLSITAQARKEGLVRLWIGSIGTVGKKAVAEAGFRPGLRIDVGSLWGLRHLPVGAAEGAGAEPGLVVAARHVLAGRGGPLPLNSSVQYARSRRH